MPTTAIICGVLLILVGIIGYVFGVMNENASLTALIPAVFGIILAILGVIARARENLRMHLMHGAVIVGLLGFFMTAGRLVMNAGKIALNAATLAQAAMALICLGFVILCIKSFIDARRNRTDS